MLQGVIDRMASNSSSAKAWCITLVSAIIVLVADKGNPRYLGIALFPSVLFCVLDTYYLALERGFRESHRGFLRKLHEGSLKSADVYAIQAGRIGPSQFWKAFVSFSIWPFYGTLVVMIFVTGLIAL